MGTEPTAGDEEAGKPPTPPVNPVYSGLVGVSGVILAVVGGALFAVFLGLDTVQFIETGQESPTFQAIAHASGAVGIGGIVVSLVKSYLLPRK